MKRGLGSRRRVGEGWWASKPAGPRTFPTPSPPPPLATSPSPSPSRIMLSYFFSPLVLRGSFGSEGQNQRGKRASWLLLLKRIDTEKGEREDKEEDKSSIGVSVMNGYASPSLVSHGTKAAVEDGDEEFFVWIARLQVAGRIESQRAPGPTIGCDLTQRKQNVPSHAVLQGKSHAPRPVRDLKQPNVSSYSPYDHQHIKLSNGDGYCCTSSHSSEPLENGSDSNAHSSAVVQLADDSSATFEPRQAQQTQQAHHWQQQELIMRHSVSSSPSYADYDSVGDNRSSIASSIHALPQPITASLQQQTRSEPQRRRFRAKDHEEDYGFDDGQAAEWPPKPRVLRVQVPSVRKRERSAHCGKGEAKHTSTDAADVDHEGCEGYSWYLGRMERSTTEAALVAWPEGTFVVRHGRGCKVITLRFPASPTKQFFHVRIQCENELYFVAKEELFPTIPELVAFYILNPSRFFKGMSKEQSEQQVLTPYHHVPSRQLEQSERYSCITETDA